MDVKQLTKIHRTEGKQKKESQSQKEKAFLEQVRPGWAAIPAAVNMEAFPVKIT